MSSPCSHADGEKRGRSSTNGHKSSVCGPKGLGAGNYVGDGQEMGSVRGYLGFLCTHIVTLTAETQTHLKYVPLCPT